MAGVSTESTDSSSPSTGSRVDQWIKQQQEDQVKLFLFGSPTNVISSEIIMSSCLSSLIWCCLTANLKNALVKIIL